MPIQPLSDNLESVTYETFEKDPVKYKLYKKAVKQVVLDRLNTDNPVKTVMVLGAGRGPLVR